jgi:protein-disulfide isomerase
MSLKPPVSERDHIQGNPNAKVELVEFGDYQCPHCGRAYPIIKQVQEALGDQLKFVFRNFPLAEIHPQARIAAVATEAANRQGKYWEMHDIVFENQQQLRLPQLLGYARTLGLNMEQFETDIGDDALTDIIDEDFESGVRSGVNGTPTFFIDGHKYTGSWEAEPLISFIREKIAQDK